MRKILMAAAALAIAGPAAAQQQQQQAPKAQSGVVAPLPDPRDEELRRSLPDPRELQAIGDTATRAIDAMMNVPIGPLREAVEGRKLSRKEREETLGDHARKDDPNLPERMRGQMGLATAALGALTEQMAVMAPVLRRTLEDAQRRVEEAARGAPPRNYDRR